MSANYKTSFSLIQPDSGTERHGLRRAIETVRRVLVNRGLLDRTCPDHSRSYALKMWTGVRNLTVDAFFRGLDMLGRWEWANALSSAANDRGFRFKSVDDTPAKPLPVEVAEANVAGVKALSMLNDLSADGLIDDNDKALLRPLLDAAEREMQQVVR